ncbi:unnamed protein product, partial [Scytosiphon promiscuus]
QQVPGTRKPSKGGAAASAEDTNSSGRGSSSGGGGGGSPREANSAGVIKLKLVLGGGSSGGGGGTSAPGTAAAGDADGGGSGGAGGGGGAGGDVVSDQRQERRRQREETLAAQAFYAELQRLPGISSKREARRMLKDAIPPMADVPSPPQSPSSRANTKVEGNFAEASPAESSSAGGGDGVSREGGGGEPASTEERGAEGGEGRMKHGGDAGDGGAPSVEEHSEAAPRCAFCGDLELALCSTLVEGPTWEEALDDQLQAPSASSSAGDDLEAAAKRRIAAMGICGAPSAGDESNVDLTRCQWVPIDKSLRDVELRSGDSEKTGAKIMRGSLAVHEVCAEGMLGLRAAVRKRAREKARLTALTLAAMNRWGGRSLPLGTDRSGRQYFIFPADPLSVYVQPTTPDKAQGLAQEGQAAGGDGGGDDGDDAAAAADGGVAGGDGAVWKVFRGKEAVAGLALGLSPRVPDERWLQAALIRHYPEAVEVLRDPSFPRRLAASAAGSEAETPAESKKPIPASSSGRKSPPLVLVVKQQPKAQHVSQIPRKASAAAAAEKAGARGGSFAPGQNVWVSRTRKGESGGVEEGVGSGASEQ